MKKHRHLIDSKQESPITIDIFIKKMRKKGFTPNHAKHILSLTNHHANIKQILKEINKLPTIQERLKFKFFVLGAIDSRETTPNTYNSLKQLAIEGNYLDEFVKADSKRKLYSPTDCSLITLHAENHSLHVKQEDLSSYQKLKIVRDNLPKFVRLFNSKPLPEICDFTDVEEINLFYAHFTKTNKLIFRKNALVTFNSANDNSFVHTLELPEILDLSNCGSVKLCSLDLSSTRKIILNNVYAVHLEGSRYIPDDIDFSSCDFVFLNDAIITNINNLSFKKDSTLELEGNTIPAHLDITNCANVTMDSVSFDFNDAITFSEKKSVSLKYIDVDNKTVAFDKIKNLELIGMQLKNVDSLSFNEVETLTFNDIDSFPATLDLSNCRDVFFTDNCDLSNIKTIILKNKAQLQHLEELASQDFDYIRPSEYTDKIIYKETQNIYSIQKGLYF